VRVRLNNWNALKQEMGQLIVGSLGPWLNDRSPDNQRAKPGKWQTGQESPGMRL